MNNKEKYCDKIEIEEIIRIDIPYSFEYSYIIEYIFNIVLETFSVRYYKEVKGLDSHIPRKMLIGVQDFNKYFNIDYEQYIDYW